MLQVTLSLVDILFLGVMTGALIWGVKCRRFIETNWTRIATLASASSRSLITGLPPKKDLFARKHIAELEGEVKSLLGVNTELQNTLYTLEHYCLGLERELELDPSEPSSLTPLNSALPAPLPAGTDDVVQSSRHATVVESDEHDGQGLHTGSGGRRLYAEALGQSAIAPTPEESDRRTPLPVSLPPASQPSAPLQAPTAQDEPTGETKSSRVCKHGSTCKQAKKNKCRFEHPELDPIAA